VNLVVQRGHYDEVDRHREAEQPRHTISGCYERDRHGQEQRELGISTYWTQVIVAGDQSHRWRYGAAAFSWYGHTWFLLRRNENSEETEWLLAELYPGSTMQATSYFRAIMPLTNVDPRHDLVTFLSSWLPTHESARARRPDGGRMEGDADQRPS